MKHEVLERQNFAPLLKKGKCDKKVWWVKGKFEPGFADYFLEKLSKSFCSNLNLFDYLLKEFCSKGKCNKLV